MLRKTNLLLSLMFMWVVSFAQYYTIGVDARSYGDAVSQAEEFAASELEKGYDFTFGATERIMEVPTFDQLANGNWGFQLHGIDEAFSYIEQKQKTKVAIFIVDDCGGYTHDDINWLPQFAKTFTGETVVNQGKHSHHVAGIAAGYKQGLNLGTGSPLAKGKKLAAIPLKALTDAGSGQYTWVASALFYAKQIIPQLRQLGYTKFAVNLSLGGSSDSDIVDSALSQLEAEGVIVYAAAGNTGGSPVQYPGRSIYTQGVGALTEQGATVVPATYTSKGPEVVISGAGTSVYSCQPNNSYTVFSGTSMATPQVAGVACDLMAVEPELTLAQVKQRMTDGAVDVPPIGKDIATGYGYPVAKYVLNIEENPDEPDDEPEPPAPPTFTSTLTYNMDGAKMKYKNTVATSFSEIKLDQVHITVTGLGNTNAVYDNNSEWSDTYFSRTYMVVPADPQWGHCLTAYWAGQFYEYASKSAGIGAQITWLLGTDTGGQNCYQSEFNRASASITSFTNSEGVVVMNADTGYGTVTAYYTAKAKEKKKRCNIFKRILKGCK
jgi:hypothetical protein